MLTISHSSSQAFARCPMAYYYSKIIGIRLIEDQAKTAVKLGKFWDAVEQLYHGCSIELEAFALDDYGVAKVRAMSEAVYGLGLAVDEGCQCQVPIKVQLDGAIINGFIDRLSDHITETKFTSRPEIYHSGMSIKHQVGTYFLGRPEIDRCVIQAARCPQLRPSDGEEPEAFADRCYKDIMSRPNYYFYKLNSKGEWGHQILRSELDLDYLKKIYQHEVNMIKHLTETNGWYCNYKGCNTDFICDYYDICSTGVISEDLYIKA